MRTVLLLGAGAVAGGVLTAASAAGVVFVSYLRNGSPIG